MGAPWVFVTLAAICGGGGWAIGRFMYGERIAALGERIEALKSRIETRDERIAGYEATRSLEKEKPSPVEKDKPPARLPPVPVSLPEAGAALKLTPAMAAKLRSAHSRSVQVTPRDSDSFKDKLVRQRWTFYFSPNGNNGSKSMTFLPGGVIGEGRNDNEFRWEFEGDMLAIYRRNGDVQNSFRYNAASGRFEYLPDQRAQGFKDQYLQPR